MASVCAFHLKVVLRRLEGVGECVGEVVGDFCVCCVAVAVAVAWAIEPRTLRGGLDDLTTITSG